MTGLEALQSVQYETVQGKRLAVVSLEEWEAMLEWLEDLEDVRIARKAYEEFQAAVATASGLVGSSGMRSLDVLAVRGRPPYDYGDLGGLIADIG
jgi:hypothetical protein